MEITGERHIPVTVFTDAADYYGHLIHLATYEYAMHYAAGKKMLDYGCGSGYGTQMLADVAAQV